MILNSIRHGALTICMAGLGWLVLVGAAISQVVIQDGFEPGSFAAAWSLTAGVEVPATGGAMGSTRFARLASYSSTTGRELGARFDGIAPDGARNFSLDFFFRVQDSANRQFHLHVSTSAGAIGSSAPALSLRYQGGWAAYDGAAWQSLTSLGTVQTNSWFRARVDGQDWGTPTARWSVQVSDLAGMTFTRSVTNLTYYQGGTPSSNPARYFVLTSVFGNSPGFDVDEVDAQVLATPPAVSNAVVNISGTYPHLAVFGTEGEMGIGAVMSWAGKLWFVTYPPHQPNGSPDKLWMVDSNLTLVAHPASVGCTDANRLVHLESRQLNIGHYLIDSDSTVRAISPALMPGRLTGSARHLTDPTNKIYIATMEEGLYEVDVNSLAVNQLYEDINSGGPTGVQSALPGQHGKGLYSAQGKVVYSNNGAGGSLSAWDGTNWTVIESNKFAEVTGPGGLYGNDREDDRLWAVGWDARSVILRLLEKGAWARYRLPKGSYTHDADHGWYTEWPRIREITKGKLLMHMHGLFYDFPKTFCSTNTGGIFPICTYLKMPVDYCWWNGQLVMGRDDASTTGGNIWAGQSHSAPWFGQLSDLEAWGKPSGFGGLWLDDNVVVNTPSEPFLVKGFQHRTLHLKHSTGEPVNFKLQHDATGFSEWKDLATISVPADGYAWYVIPAGLTTTWVRLIADRNASSVTAYFHLQNSPQGTAPELFTGLAPIGSSNALSEGIIRPQTGDARTLQFAASVIASNGAVSKGYYEIDGSLQLRRVTNSSAENTLRTAYSLSNASFALDAASVIRAEGTNRFRLPRSSPAYDVAFAAGWPRGVREVVTERQMFQAHGTFYELPLSGSGGFRKVRPITTHGRHISDCASWRGLFVFAGVAAGATNHGHVIRSEDGQAALWFGNVDDLWRMGAPWGVGGPWKNSFVTPGIPSDPYLMFGYEHKILELSHTNSSAVTFTVEVDFAANNSWSEYVRLTVQPGEVVKHVFPEGYSSHWVRLISDAATSATAWLTYGPAAPRITGTQMPSAGGFGFTFTGPVGWPYRVRASQDPAVPVAAWPSMTNGSFTGGDILYHDPASTGFGCRFYSISVP